MKKLNRTFLKAGFCISLFLVVRFLLGFDGLYGQDAYEYLRYTKEMYSFFVNQSLLGNFFWGLAYPFFGSLMTFFVRDAALALQLISMLSGLVIWIYFDKLIALIYKKEPNYLIGFLFFALSPLVFVQGLLVMSDMLACSFLIVSIYYLLKYLSDFKNGNYFLGIIFLALAAHTRYATLVILLPFAALVFLKILSQKKFSLLIYAALIAFVFSIPHFLLYSTKSLKFLSHDMLITWNPIHLFQSSFSTSEGKSSNKFINLIYAFYSFFHPQFFAFGAVLLVVTFVYRLKVFIGYKFQNLVFISVVIYAIFLGGINFQNKRFLVLSFPLVIVFLYPLLQQVFGFQKFQKMIIILVVFTQIGFISFYGAEFYKRNKFEQMVANDLMKYSGRTIYIFDLDIALKGRNVSLDFQNIWYKEYNSFNKSALVLINAAQLEKQWVGKNPLINWNKLKKAENLKVLKSYPDGWDLFEIQ